MKKNILFPHTNKSLNVLRLVALVSVGLYFYKVYKTEGSLLGATGKNTKFNLNTDKIVDGLSGHVHPIYQAGIRNVLNKIKGSK